MSNEIKQGDKVRVSRDIPQFYRRYNSYRVFEVEHQVVDIEDGLALLDSIPSKYVTTIPTKYLVKVEAQADANERLQEEYARFMGGRTSISFADRIVREHIQRRMRVISQDDFLKEINPAEHEVNPKPRYIPKIMFNTEFWVKYEADLAKEVALKVANKYNDPRQAAEYAVKVAKAVVKNLKQK